MRERRAAIVTAGPPGAGKSTAIGNLGGFRPIDADDIKDLLIAQALRDGDYEAQLAQQLPDAHPVDPREMSMLFHVESWRVVSQVRAIALARGKNIVAHGTLAYQPYGHDLLNELLRADYSRLMVVAVDVPESVAAERALTRWWNGRLVARRHMDPLGGRYVNVHRVVGTYWASDGTPICTENARRMAAAATAAGMTTELTVNRADS